ncbi:hypothetical protein ACTMTJ_35780 [Phytohabitans sp. LJ34]|uniref:hypothetical protein n=1 Tax=Phytohabitans sp. LJ34 TaxID=3452217 RepID=UPI003F898D6A
MSPALPPTLTEFLGRGDAASSVSVGLVVLGVLLAVLVARVLIQSADPFPRRDVLHLLTVVAAPLLVVFAAIVLERFRDLS